MKSEYQRKIFLKIGHQKALNALDHNSGRPLSGEQLQTYLDESIAEGLVSRAVALSSLTACPLTPTQLGKLIDRCICCEWFPDAIYASQLGPIPNAAREKLLKTCIENNLAANRKQAEDLLASD